MSTYILRRMLLTVPTIVGRSVLVFLILHLTPGDPALVVAGPTAPPDVVELIRAQLGLDQPVVVQYWRYVSQAVRGDLGRSILSRRPVSEEVATAFANTLELVLAARVWSLLVAIPIGVLAAVKRRSIFDKLSMVIALLGLSLPIFWIGLMAIWLFAFTLGWFPISARVEERDAPGRDGDRPPVRGAAWRRGGDGDDLQLAGAGAPCGHGDSDARLPARAGSDPPRGGDVRYDPSRDGPSVRRPRPAHQVDRKSTRLNSSHGYISYAVFCLKKKKKKTNTYVYIV